MNEEEFSISRFSPSIQKICKLPSPYAHSPNRTAEQIDYVGQFSLTDDDIPALLEIARWYGKEHELDDEDMDKCWYAPVHAWNALSRLTPKKIVPKALEIINHIDLSDGNWFDDLYEPLAELAIRDTEMIPLFLTAMKEDQRHEVTRSLILEAARYATVQTSLYQKEFHEILVEQLKEMRIDRRNWYASIVCELAFTENMTQELKELLRKVCLDGLVNLSIVACNDGLKENVGLDFEDDPALQPMHDEFKKIDDILRSFRYCNSGFPREAVLQAREYKERIIPSLIQAVRNATAIARFEVHSGDGSIHFAVHLLAEFDAKEGLPAILDSLSLTEDQCWDYLYNDALYESMPGILYRLIGNDFDFYDAKFRDAQTSPVLRTVLLEAFPYLVKNEALEGAKYYGLIAEYLRIAIDENNERFATSLICDLSDSRDPQYWTLAQEAFDKDLIEKMMIDRDTVEADLHGRSTYRRSGMERIETKKEFTDTVTELEGWSWFQPESYYDDDDDDKPDYDALARRYTQAALDRALHFSSSVEDDDTLQEQLETGLNIGRNNPCPCGSGKKYKVCCGK